MVMRELTSGEAEACREKAIDKVNCFIQMLEGKSDVEKYNALHSHFEAIARATRMASENFDPDKYTQRENCKQDPVSMFNLLKAAICGHQQMTLLRQEMAQLKNDRGEVLALVNGTSQIFSRMTQAIKIEENFINIGNDYVTKGIVPENCPLRPDQPTLGVVARLTCASAQLLSIVMVAEDLMAA